MALSVVSSKDQLLNTLQSLLATERAKPLTQVSEQRINELLGQIAQASTPPPEHKTLWDFITNLLT